MAGSMELRIGFVLLSAVLLAGFALAVRRVTGDGRRAGRAAIGGAVWMGLTAALAGAGVLRFGPFPPTMLLVFVAVAVIVVRLGRSELGRLLATGLPLAVLVGFQGFRVLVELLLHRAYVEGLMPVQMSYAGYNFDILTGISAVLLGGLLARGTVSLGVIRLWNYLGLALLLNVLVIALLSAPTPLRVFHNEPSNIWVTGAPWVWLPAVMVLSALLGHWLLFRRLALETERGRPVA